jgi:hypothetical protein
MRTFEDDLMNRKSRQIKDASMQPALKLAALISVVAGIAACDGANQGVQIGTGQNPDPVVIDFPIAYVKQPIPVDDNGEFEQQDLREQITFQIGGNLYFRDRASPSALEVNITEPIIGDQGDVRDVEIAYDGSKLLFSMRGPADPNLALDDEDQPTWNLWEYTFETAELRRVISTDLTAENGDALAGDTVGRRQGCIPACRRGSQRIRIQPPCNKLGWHRAGAGHVQSEP